MSTRKRIILRLVSIVLLIGAGAGVPLLVQCRRMARKQMCFENLLILDHAINCGVPMSQRLALGAPVKQEDVALECRDGVIPSCPSGPEYEIDYHVGKNPICPVHGNLIAETGSVPHEPFKRPLQVDYFPIWVRICVGTTAVVSALVCVAWLSQSKRKN